MLKGCGPVGALRASEISWRWFSACCQFYHLGELMYLQEGRQKQSYKGSNQCEQNLICFYRITLLENQELFAVRESYNCFSCTLIKPQMKKIQKADVPWSCHTIWESTLCFFIFVSSFTAKLFSLHVSHPQMNSLSWQCNPSCQLLHQTCWN